MRNAAVFLEVADWLPDPLVLVRRNGDIVAANRAAVRQLHMPSAPLSGERLSDRVGGAYGPVDEFLRRCTRTRGPLPGRIPLRLPDGRVLSCRCNGGLFHEQTSDGPPLVLLRILRPDTTVSEFQRLNERLESLRKEMAEIRRASEERLRLEAQLMQAQKLESLGVLAGGIAHDFNNLLTGILGNIDLALLDTPPDAPTAELLAQALTGAQRAAELTQQMLAYSGKGRFVVEPLDMSAIVADMGSLLGVSTSKKVTMHYDLAPGLPAVSGDATQLRQVVMNLIINASEAIGDRPGSITARTASLVLDDWQLSERGLRPDLTPGPHVLLEVLDTGTGMNDETRQRLFEPFYTTKFTGRGLGLAAVQGIVRGHRGAIRVTSTLGEGSRFAVYLPALASPAPARRIARAPEAWQARGRALVVDDDAAVRQLAASLLSRFGFSVTVADDGHDGVERFREGAAAWTLVLLDMTMPRLDGREAFEAMRRIRANVPTILMSGYNEQTATNRFVGDGVAAFIAKPFNLHQLQAVVRQVIDGTAGA